MEIVVLAHDMVRLEAQTRRAREQRLWARVGDLEAEREQVREHRSELLREFWLGRRGLLL